MPKFLGKKSSSKHKLGRKRVSMGTKSKKSLGLKLSERSTDQVGSKPSRPIKVATYVDLARPMTIEDAETPKVRKRALALARRLLNNPQIGLETPNSQFGDRKPIDLIQTNEAIKVYNLLHAAELGLF